MRIKRLVPRSLAMKPGRLGSFLLALALGVLMFFIGFFVSFPNDVLRDRVQFELSKRVPGSVTLGRVGFSLPFGIGAEKVTVRMRDPAIPELQFDTIRLAPQFATLMGDPGVDFNAETGRGQLRGSAGADGRMSLEIIDYPVDQPILGFTEIRLAGRIDTAQIDAFMNPDPDKPSRVTLQASGLALTGTESAGLPIDRLNLGELNLQLTGKGRNVDVTAAGLSGGDIRATATGNLLIGRTAASTRLNLDVLVSPTASLDPSVASLLELVGSPDGSGGRKFSVRGTALRPVAR